MKFGLVLRVQDPPNGTHIQSVWEENFAITKVAEEAGFDCVVTPEHHGIPDGYNPTPLVTLAALARETKRIRLATGCHLMPLHHPLFVAEEAAMVDILSNGRLILGCAISNVEGEFKRLGLDKRQQASRFDEGLEVLKKSLD